MIKRPILIATIGYLTGIIIGLYCKISIAIFVIFLFSVYFLLKILTKDSKFKKKKFIVRVKQYLKIFNIKKVILIILISAFIANTIVLVLNNSYENKYKNIEKAKFVATIDSVGKEKEYFVQYKIEIDAINDDKTYKGTHLYLNVKNNTNLKYGDKIEFNGTYTEPEVQRNYKGFDYKEYLKSVGIYGVVKANSVNIIGINQMNIMKQMANNVADNIKQIVKENIKEEDNQNLLLGMLLGYDDELQKDIKENFQDSSLSHLLAVSGMHVAYVILGINIIFNTLKCPKKIAKIFTIILLIFFIFLTGETRFGKKSLYYGNTWSAVQVYYIEKVILQQT